MVQIVREETGLGKIGSCNSGLVSNYVRTVAALNFVALSKVLSSCWAFSIAFDGACSGVTTFIDLRLRFYKDDIQDFHGILIPLSGAHTGENVFLHIRKFLEVVCPVWRSKLIGASADGAANMQGHISGTVTRFAEEATAPGNIVPLTLFSPFSLPLLFSPFSFHRLGAQFTRVWCLLHQIALPVKDAYECIDNGRWLLSTTNKIAHMRRQFNWIEEIKSKCPYLALTRWLSMGNFAEWAYDKRVQINEMYAAIIPQHQTTPDDQWWLTTIAVKVITSPINAMVSHSQGRRIIISQIMTKMDQLIVDLQSLSGMDSCYVQRCSTCHRTRNVVRATVQ